MRDDLASINEGIELLRTRWPQSHFVPGPHGENLIFVPSVVLPKGYRETICTVLFVAPAGFPAQHPHHFFTDIDVRLENGAHPAYTSLGNFPRYAWQQWSESKRWHWRLQMWDPNRSGLYTFMKVIQQRLNPAR